MTHYAASTVPIKKETKVLRFEEGETPTELALGAFELIAMLKAGDHLWLMMGSTNAAVALGAYRRGVQVHQLSYVRATSQNGSVEGESPGTQKKKVSHQDVYRLAIASPSLFYAMYPRQSEVLEVIDAWETLNDAMKIRIRYANGARSRMQRRALIYGELLGVEVSSCKELDPIVEERVGLKNPQDARMRMLLESEAEASKGLEKVLQSCALYQNVFEPIEGVGPRLAVRFIAGIERIERFETPEDLMRYAGLMPTRNGKLPSKKQGGIVSRSVVVNNACFLLQDHMFQYGAKTPFGRMIHEYIERECPCTAANRKADKDLRARHFSAVKRGRILMSREFLRQVWRDWSAYLAEC